MTESNALQLGLESLKAQKVDDAIKYLEQATDEAPQDFRGFTYLGVAYSQKGFHNRAIGAFQAALRIKPDMPSIRYNLGLAYQADGLVQMAKDEFQRALDMDPSYQKAAEALHALESGDQPQDSWTDRSCGRHQDEPATGECSFCRLPVCRICKTVVNGQTYCSNCAPK